jgi:hypothetical protein
MFILDAFGRNIDLAKNDYLRIIRLPCIFLYPGSSHRESIPLILARISSPRIEEVYMMILIAGVEDLDLLDCVAMNRIFARRNYSQIKRIHISVNAQTSPYFEPDLREKLLSRLNDRLPACGGRGILDVEVNYLVSQYA